MPTFIDKGSKKDGNNSLKDQKQASKNLVKSLKTSNCCLQHVARLEIRGGKKNWMVVKGLMAIYHSVMNGEYSTNLAKNQWKIFGGIYWCPINEFNVLILM